MDGTVADQVMILHQEQLEQVELQTMLIQAQVNPHGIWLVQTDLLEATETALVAAAQQDAVEVLVQADQGLTATQLEAVMEDGVYGAVFQVLQKCLLEAGVETFMPAQKTGRQVEVLMAAAMAE
jgi:hypothetical protein